MTQETTPAIQHPIWADVQEDDIKAGIAGDCFACPLARALMRQFPQYNVVMRYGYLGLYEKTQDLATSMPREIRFALHPEAQSFMYRFDSARSFVPAVPGRVQVTKEDGQLAIFRN